MDERETLLRRDALLIGIAGFSLVNGMHFSPWFDPAYILLRPFAPAFFVSSPILMFYFTSLFVSLMTLLMAGVPAALYERFQGLTQSTPRSMFIWFVVVALLSLPAVTAMMTKSPVPA